MIRERLLYTGVAILGFVVLNGVIGLIRGPIDQAHMLRMDSDSRTNGESWGVVEPRTTNYFMGSYGLVWQIRKGNQYYQITSHRYLNVLPDMESSPQYLGIFK